MAIKQNGMVKEQNLKKSYHMIQRKHAQHNVCYFLAFYHIDVS